METRAPSRSVATPREAAEVFTSILGNEAVEVFGILCLSTKRHLIAYHQISRGLLSQTLAGPREIFQVALLANASGIVLGHNHPSGDPSPSPDDLILTERLVKAGKLMGIDVMDHIIVGHEGRYFSFKELGKIVP
ncbi:MAG: JAB domain-containing protein [Vicinamibacterales bacterium]